MMTLDQVIDNATQLPQEQQEMLIDILSKRQVEVRRNEIARDAQRSLDNFRTGKFRPQPMASVLDNLHSTLEELADDL